MPATDNLRARLPHVMSEARFRRLYEDHGREILAYCLRRAEPEDARDALADTFLVVWRRIDDVPTGDAARLWLYGVARRTLATQMRGDRRRRRLAHRLGSQRSLPPTLDDSINGDHQHPQVHEALGRLDPGDQELLRLTAWEGLSPGEAAQVLGISSVAARSRLHRARRRLRRELEPGWRTAPINGVLEPEDGR